VAVRAVAAYLRRGTPAAAAYVARTFAADDAVYGLSDVDLIVVFPGDPERPKAEHIRLKKRWERLARSVPPLAALFPDTAFYEDAALREAIGSSVHTFGLESGAAAFFGAADPFDDLGLRTRPGIRGPTRDWRLVAGPERRPPLPPFGAEEQRIAAWLELQFWWGNAFELAARPDAPWGVYGAAKLLSEPARILLAFRGQGFPPSRREALELALRRLPEHEPGLRLALELLRRLGRSGDGDDALGRALPHALRLSAAIAAELAAAAEDAEGVEVALRGGGADLIRPGGEPRGGLLPLADWRAVCTPSLPDEALEPWPGEADDLETSAAAARAGARGPYPLLRAGELLLLPALGLWTRSLLRAIQCAITDPVSTAVVEGRAHACFPGLAGWSARDWARRGVAEHRAWLASPPASKPRRGEWLDGAAGWMPAPARDVAKLLTAARAGLFLESLEGDEAELALTLAAVVERLGARDRDAGATAAEALGVYRESIEEAGVTPHGAERAAAALREVVAALPAYQV
jgi:hypothetical protein